MLNVRPETSYEVTELAVIRHPDRGILLIHSREQKWHFPFTTVRIDEQWDDSLRRAVTRLTGIDDLLIGPVMMVQNYGPGEVDERAQYGVFFLCSTKNPPTGTDLMWAGDAADLARREFFHPLVPELVERALGSSTS
jgi:hypothetical protein